MKRFLLFVLAILIAVIAVSCSDTKELEGNVYFCSVALDYKCFDAVTNLNTELDQKNWVEQIKLVSNNKAKIKTFCCFGTRPDYISDSDKNYVTPVMIQEYLTKLAKEVKKDDVFIFHYSGHGYYDGSLCLNSSEPVADTTVNKMTTLTTATLNSWLANLDCNKVLLIDSCYSGYFVPQDSFSDGNSYKVSTSKTDSITGKVLEKESFAGNKFVDSLKNAIKDFGENTDSSKRLWVISAASSKQEAGDSPYGGYLSMFCLDYIGCDYLTKEHEFIKDQTYTVYGMYDHYLSFMNSNRLSSYITLFTPQTNVKPVDLVLFRT